MTPRRHYVANDVVGIPGRATLLNTNALQIQDGGESSVRTVLVKPFRMAPWRFQILNSQSCLRHGLCERGWTFWLVFWVLGPSP